MKLDPFYLIVDSADWIERLVPLGVKLVQLRMKDAEESVLRQHSRRARQCCAEGLLKKSASRDSIHLGLILWVHRHVGT